MLIHYIQNHYLGYGLIGFALQKTPGSAIHVDYDVNGALDVAVTYYSPLIVPVAGFGFLHKPHTVSSS